jgi:hypothetical protein
MNFRFAPAINSHASPERIHHSRGTLRKLFQKIRQMPGLRGLDCQLH